MSKLIRWLAFTAGLTAALFGRAGRWDLPMVWAYVGVFSGVGLVALLKINDPGLSQERLHPGPGGVDRQMRIVAPVLMVLHYVVAGLDVGRFHSSDTIPLGLQVVALAGFGAGIGVVFWAMAVNTFFSPVVRIQAERGHRVIVDGPYRHVRHPGYLGMVVAFPLSGVALGSLWSAVPAVALALLVLRRTNLEDRFLRERLPGYADYARQVRYRLVPGVW